jgi:hypothetical protein
VRLYARRPRCGPPCDQVMPLSSAVRRGNYDLASLDECTNGLCPVVAYQKDPETRHELVQWLCLECAPGLDAPCLALRNWSASSSMRIQCQSEVMVAGLAPLALDLPSFHDGSNSPHLPVNEQRNYGGDPQGSDVYPRWSKRGQILWGSPHSGR